MSFRGTKSPILLFEKEIEFMTAKEAAVYLRLSPGALYNLVSSGKIKPYRLLGRRLRFCKDDLKKLLLDETEGDI